MAEKEKRGTPRLEELLLDDSVCPSGGGSNTDQDVRVVGGKQGSHINSLIILIVFCLLVLGIGYFYLQSMATTPSARNQYQYYTSPKLPIPARPETVAVDVSTVVEQVVVDNMAKFPEEVVGEKIADIGAAPVNQPASLLTVSVGPLISDDEVTHAVEQLQQLGFQPETKRGRGLVTMIRLLEGTYPAAIAHNHLSQLKKNVKSAFLLPQGDQLAVFAGSFHQENRAKTLQSDLAKKNVHVTLVDGNVEMVGTLLTVIQADQQTAREVANLLSGLGLKTSISEKK